MDTQSYEQYALAESLFEGTRDYLLEEASYRFLTVDGQPVALQLPPSVVLEVTDTAPPEHGSGGSSVHKEATLASGCTVMVPLFIKAGDRIRVSTENGEYQGKEH